MGFLIDNRKCIGCHACTVACKSEHDVPIGVDRTWVKYVEKGTFPNNRRLFTVMRCNHCEDSPCTTICPVTALYRRDDGIVDFNNERCIGCKACMQACPYDALHIDPVTQTAAKCNFCTHRVEIGLEPSCVQVCPEQAIVAGDLQDPNSNISQLIDRHPVTVRKPEKGTRPNLFYIDADAASLVPTHAQTQQDYLWSSSAEESPAGLNNRQLVEFQGIEECHRENAKRVYDVRTRKPAWGWEVVAYTWTKAVSTGSFLATGLLFFLSEDGLSKDGITSGISGKLLALTLIAILFLLLTMGLLVADLKQPKRFLNVLLRPQWGSWLVRGAYTLIGFTIVLSLWLLGIVINCNTLMNWVLGPGVFFAILSAVYTAFLLAQAKGRDFWQNPLMSLHFLSHALIAGGAVWLLIEFLSPSIGAHPNAASGMTLVGLIVSAIAILGEKFTAPPTSDARLAMKMITSGENGLWFWGGGVIFGHAIPIILLFTQITPLSPLATIFSLFGIVVIESLWIVCPQRIPLS